MFGITRRLPYEVNKSFSVHKYYGNSRRGPKKFGETPRHDTHGIYAINQTRCESFYTSRTRCVSVCLREDAPCLKKFGFFGMSGMIGAIWTNVFIGVVFRLCQIKDNFCWIE